MPAARPWLHEAVSGGVDKGGTELLSQAGLESAASGVERRLALCQGWHIPLESSTSHHEVGPGQPEI